MDWRPDFYVHEYGHHQGSNIKALAWKMVSVDINPSYELNIKLEKEYEEELGLGHTFCSMKQVSIIIG